MQTSLAEQERKRRAVIEARETGDQDAIKQAELDLAAADADVKTKRDELATAQDTYRTAHGTELNKLATARDFRKAALNDLTGFVPGASFRFTSASSRSISMSQTFDRPLVVGYLGYDIPIGVNGELGRPIPTHALLDPESGVKLPTAQSAAFNVNQTSALNNLYQMLKIEVDSENEVAKRSLVIVDQMSAFIPATQLVYQPDQIVYEDGTAKEVSTFKTVDIDQRNRQDFRGYLGYDRNRGIVIRRLLEAQEKQIPAFLDGFELDNDQISTLVRDLQPQTVEQRRFREAKERLVLSVVN